MTAAGHILANETIHDGIRELEEEIGIRAEMDELKALGEVEYSVTNDDFIDKEIAHVYLYDNPLRMEDFTLQPEEVCGIVKAEFDSFQDFWKGSIHKLEVDGFKLGPSGNNKPFRMNVDRSHFVPHFDYFKRITKMIRKYLYE
ncbi:NUDIX domain-containing protein [Pseudalkalibacillus sp. A8]|uniref:NUDIX domain-containing protein n=1 Tax=Pseudalkalibacillus sp. A8 TaxID=3382641 RepID=UPI0038B6025A